MMEASHPELGLNRERPPAPRKRSSFLSFFITWLRDIVIAVALALVIIAFIYQPVKVEGTSMVPLLGDQERIFINKFIYELGPIARGDVVVFRYPRDPRKSFIKRVVGLPGELVEIRRGVVYINGVSLHEDYITATGRDDDSFSPMLLSEGQYFVLGDHRRNSNDSRAWGMVHREHIYGKAVFAYWPPNRFGRIVSAAGEE